MFSEVSAVRTFVLDRPPANALTPGVLAELDECLLEVEEGSSKARALVIAANGRFFSAGVDVGFLASVFASSDPAAAMADFSQTLHDVFGRLERLPIPTIAAMQGSALGGGLELALACDFRIGSSGASYGLPEIKLGLLPGAGGTQRLRRAVGHSLAQRMLLRGELLDADTACSGQLLHWVYDGNEVSERARHLALEMASLAGAGLAAIKSCVLAPTDELGFDAERAAATSLVLDTRTRDLVASFMREHSVSND